MSLRANINASYSLIVSRSLMVCHCMVSLAEYEWQNTSYNLVASSIISLYSFAKKWQVVDEYTPASHRFLVSFRSCWASYFMNCSFAQSSLLIRIGPLSCAIALVVNAITHRIEMVALNGFSICVSGYLQRCTTLVLPLHNLVRVRYFGVSSFLYLVY